MPQKKLLSESPASKRLASPPSTPLLTERKKTDWKCVVSLVSACLFLLSMVGLTFDNWLEILASALLFPLFVSIIVFGILGLLSVKKNGTHGKGFAIAGLAVAGLVLTIFLIGLVLFVSSPSLPLAGGFGP